MNEKQGESDILSKEDWRINKADELTAPFKSPWTGQLFPIGSAVLHHSSMMVKDIKFSFCVPSAPALFLGISKKSYNEAE